MPRQCLPKTLMKLVWSCSLLLCFYFQCSKECYYLQLEMKLDPDRTEYCIGDTMEVRIRLLSRKACRLRAFSRSDNNLIVGVGTGRLSSNFMRPTKTDLTNDSTILISIDKSTPWTSTLRARVEEDTSGAILSFFHPKGEALVPFGKVRIYVWFRPIRGENDVRVLMDSDEDWPCDIAEFTVRPCEGS